MIKAPSKFLAIATQSGVFPLPPRVKFPTLITFIPKSIFLAVNFLKITIRKYIKLNGKSKNASKI